MSITKMEQQTTIHGAKKMMKLFRPKQELLMPHTEKSAVKIKAPCSDM